MTRKKHPAVQLEDHLPPDQALLFSALREEFNAKLGSVKAWCIAALVGGQVVAGVIGAYVGPAHAVNSAMHAAHAIGVLF